MIPLLYYNSNQFRKRRKQTVDDETVNCKFYNWNPQQRAVPTQSEVSNPHEVSNFYDSCRFSDGPQRCVNPQRSLNININYRNRQVSHIVVINLSTQPSITRRRRKCHRCHRYMTVTHMGLADKNPICLLIALEQCEYVDGSNSICLNVRRCSRNSFLVTYLILCYFETVITSQLCICVNSVCLVQHQVLSVVQIY